MFSERDVIYISPSEFPSKSANYVHVVLQTEALSRYVNSVTLVGILQAKHSDVRSAREKTKQLFDIQEKNLFFAILKYRLPFARNIAIAVFALGKAMSNKQAVIISRNIYACFLLLIFTRRKMIYETHTVESRVRGVLQRIILRSQRVSPVVISDALAGLLAHGHIQRSRFTILPDAARAGLPMVMSRADNVGDSLIFGYFGSFHEGRGIEIIEQMAEALPDCQFLVHGPVEQNPEFMKRVGIRRNIKVCGYLAHKDVHLAMSNCDALLMPYQKSVSIGLRGSDTASFMSPMKMFEYMASGRAIVSSDLPVLREVLENGHNCLLVPSDKAAAWIEAAERLRDKSFRYKLGLSARSEYERVYNWDARAKKLLGLL